MKPVQVSAFEASDGTLFRTSAEAVAHDFMKEISGFFGQLDSVLASCTEEENIRQIIGEWEAFKHKKQQENVGSAAIESLQLSVRTTNCLKAGGIYAVEELVRCSTSDLFKLPNLGPHTVGEIIQALNRQGLSLVCGF